MLPEACDVFDAHESSQSSFVREVVASEGDTGEAVDWEIGALDRVDRMLLGLAWISFGRLVDCKLEGQGHRSDLFLEYISIVSHMPVVEPAGAVLTETLPQLNEAMNLAFKVL